MFRKKRIMIHFWVFWCVILVFQTFEYVRTEDLIIKYSENDTLNATVFLVNIPTGVEEYEVICTLPGDEEPQFGSPFIQPILIKKKLKGTSFRIYITLMKKIKVKCATRIVEGIAEPSAVDDSDPRCKSYKIGSYYTRNCTITLDFENRCDGNNYDSNQQENQANLPPIKNYDNVPNYHNDGYSTNKINIDYTTTVTESTTTHRLPDNNDYNTYWNKSKNLDGSREPRYGNRWKTTTVKYNITTTIRTKYNHKINKTTVRPTVELTPRMTAKPTSNFTSIPTSNTTANMTSKFNNSEKEMEKQTYNLSSTMENGLVYPETDKSKYYIATGGVGIFLLIVFVAYLICKKYHRKSPKHEKTLELETYATSAVLYADLRLNPASNTRPVNKTEETYAEIVGVLIPHQL